MLTPHFLVDFQMQKKPFLKNLQIKESEKSRQVNAKCSDLMKAQFSKVGMCEIVSSLSIILIFDFNL